MKRLSLALAVLALLAAGCAPAAPAAPTQAPVAPTKAPAAPTAAPAAPTKAPEATKPAAPAPAPTVAPTAAPTAAPAKKVDFPQKGKALTLIVPWQTGSSSDISARLVAQFLEKEMGNPVEVANKAGAATQIGLTEIAKARPDGYTLGVPTFAAVLTTYLDAERKAAYDRKSFMPLARAIIDDVVVAVAADGPYKSLKDLVDAAKAKPEQVKFGASGVLSNVHVVALKLEEVAGIRFAFVQFDGSAAGMTALLGGHVDAIGLGVGGVMSQYKSGKVRVLGTSGVEQNRFVPDVKTFTAQGHKVQLAYAAGVVTPAGVPKDVFDVLDGYMAKAIKNPEFRTKANDLGMEVGYMNPAEFEAYWLDYEKQVQPLIDLSKSRQK